MLIPKSKCEKPFVSALSNLSLHLYVLAGMKVCVSFSKEQLLKFTCGHRGFLFFLTLADRRRLHHQISVTACQSVVNAQSKDAWNAFPPVRREKGVGVITPQMTVSLFNNTGITADRLAQTRVFCGGISFFTFFFLSFFNLSLFPLCPAQKRGGEEGKRVRDTTFVCRTESVVRTENFVVSGLRIWFGCFHCALGQFATALFRTLI